MRIGFLGFGEAGSVLSKALLANGMAPVVAYDCDKRRVALDSGVVLVDSNRELAARSDVILSVVTADSAREAATQTAPFLTQGHVFCDCNSVSPATKGEVARIVENAGGVFVEAAIMAPVNHALERVPFLMTGAKAQSLADYLSRFGMKIEVLDGATGTAAAVKMCRSIIVKGLEALSLECTLAARHFECEQAVFESLDRSYPGFNWKSSSEYMIGRILQHGIRRAAEMNEVAAMQREAGLTPVMSLATAEVQLRSALHSKPSS